MVKVWILNTFFASFFFHNMPFPFFFCKIERDGKFSLLEEHFSHTWGALWGANDEEDFPGDVFLFCVAQLISIGCDIDSKPFLFGINVCVGC